MGGDSQRLLGGNHTSDIALAMLHYEYSAIYLCLYKMVHKTGLLAQKGITYFTRY